MLIRNWVFWIILVLLLPQLVTAKTIQSKTSNCILLGSNPSLMIKFRKISSSSHPKLESSIVNRLSSTTISFTSARPMAGGDFIVFFKPKKQLRALEIRPGCYSKATLDNLTLELKSRADIVYAEPNGIETFTALTNKLLLPIVSATQWNLKNPPGGINAEMAFATTTGSQNSIVAVLDSGILPNTSLAPNTLTGVTFNNDGLIKAVGATPSCDASCDGYDHGTHVAGIAATSGVLAYGENIYGVAPTSKIIPINIFTKFTNPIDCGGGPTPCISSYVADQVNALKWLNGEAFSGLPAAPYVTAVNMSLGGASGLGTCMTNRQSAIDALLLKNISISISSGNGNPPGTPVDAATFSPANCTGVMVVSATGPTGLGTFYSNYGGIVSFAAPGGDSNYGLTSQIYSTIENGYGYKEGTSMAAPHAAGLVALLYSVDPTLTPSLVTSILQSSSLPFPVGTPAGRCSSPGYPCGSGIINANNAVLATVAQAPILSWTPNLTATPPTTTTVTLNWAMAAWSPARATSIIYTVNLNGSNVPTCTGILGLSCTINNLTPSTAYNAYVTATDVRSIHSPLQSTTVSFNTLVALVSAPTLTTASRNPILATEAYINYSTLGVPQAPVYLIDGVPAGAIIVLDAGNSRFVVSNIAKTVQINNVRVIASNGLDMLPSNTVTIPAAYGSPTLTTVYRNPANNTQAFISYSSLGVPQAAPTFLISGILGATIALDVPNQRFVISNITNTGQINNVSVIGTDNIDVFPSNIVTIPPVYASPTLTVAQRNPLKTNQAFLYYSSLGNPQAPSFSIEGIPGGAGIVLDASHGRFVVNNINTPKAIPNVTVVGTDGFGLFPSNPITIPSIL